jgi:hypothetical protein
MVSHKEINFRLVWVGQGVGGDDDVVRFEFNKAMAAGGRPADHPSGPVVILPESKVQGKVSSYVRVRAWGGQVAGYDVGDR